MKNLLKTLLFSSLFLAFAFGISFCAKEQTVKSEVQAANTDASASSREIVGAFIQIRATVTLKSPSELTDLWVNVTQTTPKPGYSAHFKPSFPIHCFHNPKFNLGNPSSLFPTSNPGGGFPAIAWGKIGGGSCDVPVYSVDPNTGKKFISSWTISYTGDIKVTGIGNVLTIKLETFDIKTGKVKDTKVYTLNGPTGGASTAVATYPEITFNYDSATGLFI